MKSVGDIVLRLTTSYRDVNAGAHVLEDTAKEIGTTREWCFKNSRRAHEKESPEPDR